MNVHEQQIGWKNQQQQKFFQNYACLMYEFTSNLLPLTMNNLSWTRQWLLRARDLGTSSASFMARRSIHTASLLEKHRAHFTSYTQNFSWYDEAWEHENNNIRNIHFYLETTWKNVMKSNLLHSQNFHQNKKKKVKVISVLLALA